jgi:hypothetical protein
VRDSGIVKQDIHASILKDSVEDGLDALLLGNITAVGFCVPTAGRDFLHDFPGRFQVDIKNTNKGSAAGKSLSNRAANAAGSARDYGGFARKAKRL